MYKYVTGSLDKALDEYIKRNSKNIKDYVECFLDHKQIEEQATLASLMYQILVDMYSLYCMETIIGCADAGSGVLQYPAFSGKNTQYNMDAYLVCKAYELLYEMGWLVQSRYTEFDGDGQYLFVRGWNLNSEQFHNDMSCILEPPTGNSSL